MLNILKKLILQIADDIDSGNSNMTEEEQLKAIHYLNELTDKDKRLSKYQACRYLNVSRATFDSYVREGKVPRGKHQQGFKELSWSQKDLDKYIKECRDEKNK